MSIHLVIRFIFWLFVAVLIGNTEKIVLLLSIFKKKESMYQYFCTFTDKKIWLSANLITIGLNRLFAMVQLMAG